MGLAGPSLGRELRARALSHTATPQRGGVAPPEISGTKSRTVQTATSHNKWSASSRPAALDLLTMSAPSGEERTPNASAQVERAGLCLRVRRFSAAQPGVRCVKR